ncbi:MAG: serine/threonine-protein kinase [Cyanobacteria bacterium P01_D01_bin.56]
MSSSHQRSNYRLLGLVGNGQFGRVYCGVHRKTGQLVAIKYLQQHGLSTQAFLREIHCLWSLSHPNIVACYGLEHCGEGRRLVLEYCAGGTLRSLMLGSLSLGEILQLVADILSGLAHAHQQGIVHCDIKPENILLNYHGRWRAKISDFGIAKLLQEQAHHHSSGQTGSPAYMAPERFYRQYSPAADVYAVGVILFELLMGHRPFRGTPTALQSAHLNQPVPKVEPLLEPLQPVLTKALEKLPARRYPTALAMLADLKTLLPSVKSELCLPLGTPQQGYSAYDQNIALHHLVQPVYHIHQMPKELSQAPLPWIMAHGSQLAVLSSQSDFQVCQQVLDSSIQGLYPAKTGLIVSTQRTLWYGSRSELLMPLTQWSGPALVAVDAHHRWAAAVISETKQLVVTHLRKPNQVDRPMRRPLSPDLDIQQVLAVDGGHFALVGQSVEHAQEMGTQLQLWNRRGMYLTSINLGITLRQLTPMGQPHHWMALDSHAPQTVVFLSLKPLRMTRLDLDICPNLMLELPWGYLFSDAEGKLLFLDRDLNSIGGIHGPDGVTAIATVSAHELLLANWQEDDQGALHCLNLQDYDLDMIF